MQTFHIQKQIWKKKLLQHVGWFPAKSVTANFSWLTFTKNIRVCRRKCVTLSQTKLVLPEIPLPVTFFFFSLLWFTLIPIPCLYTPLLSLTIPGDILHCSNGFILTFSTDTMMGSGEIAFWRSIQICRFKPAERLKIFWKYACQQWKESCL